jgi:hypothetical protein
MQTHVLHSPVLSDPPEAVFRAPQKAFAQIAQFSEFDF